MKIALITIDVIFILGCGLALWIAFGPLDRWPH